MYVYKSQEWCVLNVSWSQEVVFCIALTCAIWVVSVQQCAPVMAASLRLNNELSGPWSRPVPVSREHPMNTKHRLSATTATHPALLNKQCSRLLLSSRVVSETTRGPMVRTSPQARNWSVFDPLSAHIAPVLNFIRASSTWDSHYRWNINPSRLKTQGWDTKKVLLVVSVQVQKFQNR